MSLTSETLLNFIEAAEKSRKYPANTAYALKTAYKLFEEVLNDEEMGSTDVFKSHIDQLYQEVTRRNLGKRFTAGSLQTYKKRVQKLLKDYYHYGVDLTKMASWLPQVRTVIRKKKEQDGQENVKEQQEPIKNIVSTPGMDTHIVDLPPRKATLIIPSDLSAKEAEKLKKYIDLSVAEENH